MAECQRCGRYAEPDRETGYDADSLCPECEEFIETYDEHCDACGFDRPSCICNGRGDQWQTKRGAA